MKYLFLVLFFLTASCESEQPEDYSPTPTKHKHQTMTCYLPNGTELFTKSNSELDYVATYDEAYVTIKMKNGTKIWTNAICVLKTEMKWKRPGRSSGR